jgi:DedD protein
MGLFSFLNKNKQDSSAQDSGHFFSADDDVAGARARSKRASHAGEGARRGRDGKAAPDPVLPEKKRARRRLVGAIALALAAAVGLPMLLDSDPKPLAGDIAIQIPSKEKAAPLPLPSDPAATPASVPAADTLDKREEIIEPSKPAATAHAAASPAATAATAATAAPAEVHAAPPKHEPVKAEPAKIAPSKAEPSKPEHKSLAKSEAKAPEPKPAEPKPTEKAVPKPARPDEKPVAAHAQSPEDAGRALAILEGKTAEKAADAQKFVIQVAALASQEKVAELQGRLQQAGIHSFTLKGSTATGARVIRVRVGPFGKDEAEKIRARLGKLGLSGSMVPV